MEQDADATLPDALGKIGDMGLQAADCGKPMNGPAAQAQ